MKKTIYWFDVVNILQKLSDSINGAPTLVNSTDLPAVPGSFADVAAVRTYLLSLQPAIETRLDALETNVKALTAALKK